MKKNIYTLSVLFMLVGLVSCNQQTFESNSTSVESTPSSESNSITSSSEDSSSTTMDEDLKTKFSEALKNNYSNLTYTEDTTMSLSVAGLGSYDASYNLVEMVTDTVYQIIYEDEEEYMIAYVEELEDGVKLYTYDQNDKCTYRIIDNESWEAVDSDGYPVYADYYLTYYNPNDFAISVDSFDYVDGKFVCKSNALNTVGNAMFAPDFSEVNFSEITIKLDGNYVKEVSFTMTANESGMDISWSSTLLYEFIGSTSVSLPKADEYVEDINYIDPKLAVDLTNEEASRLDAALAEVYNSYTCDYSSLDSDSYNAIFETLYYQDGKYDVFLDVSTQYGAQTMQLQYYLEETEEEVYLYSLNDENVVEKTSLYADELEDYYPQSYAPCEFGLTSGSFGIYENVYLFKPAALKELSANVGSTIASIEVTLDDNHQVASIQIVYAYAASSQYDAYTTTELFTYSHINDTTVTLPTVNQNAVSELNSAQIDAFNGAANADFTNVTIYDSIFGGCFFYVGNDIEELAIEDSNYYLYSYRHENGKYYANDGNGNYVEMPFETTEEEYGYSYFVPTLDFTAIDVSKLTYDSFNKLYLINYDDVNMADFLFYYSLDLSDYTFSKIAFKLDGDGHFSDIQLYLVENGEEYTGFGLSLFSYGTTQLYSSLLGE